MLILGIILFIIATTFMALCLPSTNTYLLRQYGVVVFGGLFVISVGVLFVTDKALIGEVVLFQFMPGIFYVLALDTLSMWFIVLTQFLFLLCMLSSWTSIQFRYKEFLVIMLILDLFLVNLFSVQDLFAFYICFESVLIPMFLIIGIWGSRQRRVHAAMQFFFYTLIGSFAMLIGIALLYNYTGTTSLMLLRACELSDSRQLLL